MIHSPHPNNFCHVTSLSPLTPIQTPFPPHAIVFPSSASQTSWHKRRRARRGGRRKPTLAEMSLRSLPTTLPKPLSTPARSISHLSVKFRPTTISSSLPSPSDQPTTSSPLSAFSAALALSSILLSAPLPAAADISGLTPCKESKAFAKREKQSLKKLESSLKLYAPDSAPALAIQATMEKTKRRFDNYGKQGLLCGTDGLPHLIVNGDQRHWGEFITPGLLFLYIAGWIGWVGRSYLIAISGDKKPTQKEIIIDVPLASSLLFRGFIWPVAAYRELVNGDLVVKDV